MIYHKFAFPISDGGLGEGDARHGVGCAGAKPKNLSHFHSFGLHGLRSHRVADGAAECRGVRGAQHGEPALPARLLLSRQRLEDVGRERRLLPLPLSVSVLLALASAESAGSD